MSGTVGGCDRLCDRVLIHPRPEGSGPEKDLEGIEVQTLTDSQFVSDRIFVLGKVPFVTSHWGCWVPRVVGSSPRGRPLLGTC